MAIQRKKSSIETITIHHPDYRGRLEVDLYSYDDSLPKTIKIRPSEVDKLDIEMPLTLLIQVAEIVKDMYSYKIPSLCNEHGENYGRCSKCKPHPILTQETEPEVVEGPEIQERASSDDVQF